MLYLGISEFSGTLPMYVYIVYIYIILRAVIYFLTWTTKVSYKVLHTPSDVLHTRKLSFFHDEHVTFWSCDYSDVISCWQRIGQHVHYVLTSSAKKQSNISNNVFSLNRDLTLNACIFTGTVWLVTCLTCQIPDPTRPSRICIKIDKNFVDSTTYSLENCNSSSTV